MQSLAKSHSVSCLPQSGNTLEVSPESQSIYITLQQEVALGVEALRRQSGDMAVTLFQSALQKLTSEPFYDHLVHNLLFAEKQKRIELHWLSYEEPIH
jgi:hypothetical protein